MVARVCWEGEMGSDCLMGMELLFGVTKMLLLLLNHVSYVRLCVTPQTAGSPLGSPIPGILQARTMEWVAISFSNA